MEGYIRRGEQPHEIHEALSGDTTAGCSPLVPCPSQQTRSLLPPSPFFSPRRLSWRHADGHASVGLLCNALGEGRGGEVSSQRAEALQVPAEHREDHCGGPELEHDMRGQHVDQPTQRVDVLRLEQVFGRARDLQSHRHACVLVSHQLRDDGHLQEERAKKGRKEGEMFILNCRKGVLRRVYWVEKGGACA